MAYDSPNQYLEPNAQASTTGIALGRVLELDREGARARVRIGSSDHWSAIDASVDPALLEQAQARGARVVVETGAAPCVVGVLMTARVAEIDRDGVLDISLKSFTVRAEEAVLQTPRAFLRLKRQHAELFADELIARGRLLTRILGKAIKLN